MLTHTERYTYVFFMVRQRKKKSCKLKCYASPLYFQICKILIKHFKMSLKLSFIMYHQLGLPRRSGINFIQNMEVIVSPLSIELNQNTVFSMKLFVKENRLTRQLVAPQADLGSLLWLINYNLCDVPGFLQREVSNLSLDLTRNSFWI